MKTEIDRHLKDDDFLFEDENEEFLLNDEETESILFDEEDDTSLEMEENISLNNDDDYDPSSNNIDHYTPTTYDSPTPEESESSPSTQNSLLITVALIAGLIGGFAVLFSALGAEFTPKTRVIMFAAAGCVGLIAYLVSMFGFKQKIVVSTGVFDTILFCASGLLFAISSFDSEVEIGQGFAGWAMLLACGCSIISLIFTVVENAPNPLFMFLAFLAKLFIIIAITIVVSLIIVILILALIFTFIKSRDDDDEDSYSSSSSGTYTSLWDRLTMSKRR